MADVVETGMVLRRMDIEDGRKLERQRIIDVLEYEASEWLSHYGSCDCAVRGEEVKRLIGIIERRTNDI